MRHRINPLESFTPRISVREAAQAPLGAQCQGIVSMQRKGRLSRPHTEVWHGLTEAPLPPNSAPKARRSLVKMNQATQERGGDIPQGWKPLCYIAP